MFKRILHEDWTSIIPMVAFGIMFTVFVIATVRAIRIRPTERTRLARLPLDSSPKDR